MTWGYPNCLCSIQIPSWYFMATSSPWHGRSEPKHKQPVPIPPDWASVPWTTAAPGGKAASDGLLVTGVVLVELGMNSYTWCSICITLTPKAKNISQPKAISEWPIQFHQVVRLATTKAIASTRWHDVLWRHVRFAEGLSSNELWMRVKTGLGRMPSHHHSTIKSYDWISFPKFGDILLLNNVQQTYFK